MLVRPGRYRESLELTGLDQGGALLTIQGVHPGSVIISGADDLSGGWTTADHQVYTHRWPFNWHYAPSPGHGWPELAPIVRSRAMIIVNGVRMSETPGGMPAQPGTFAIQGGDIALNAPAGVDVKTAAIEVAARPTLLEARGRVNSLVLRDLVFEYASTGVSYAKAAAVVLSGSNITIEQCDFRYNNWTGLTIVGGDHIKIGKSSAEYNGEDGMTLWQISELSLTDDAVEFNNWRGYAGGSTGWDAAGLKALRLKGATIASFVSFGNYSNGLWCDTANSNVNMSNLYICHNLGSGIFVEKTQGPVVLKDSTIRNNGDAGLQGSFSTNVRLSGNLICGNKNVQLRIGGSDVPIVIHNSYTSESISLLSANWTLDHNHFVASGPNQAFVGTYLRGSWTQFENTLTSAGNTWGYRKGMAVPRVESPSGGAGIQHWLSTVRDSTSAVAPVPAPACPK